MTAVPVGVTLLGVRVTAYGVIDTGEHLRRQAAGLGAVSDPALLDRLLDLPIAIPVRDPVMWAEMADQPPGILERNQDSVRITRRLESPLIIADVVVDAAAGRELRAVQDASLFAGFTRRWAAVARSRVPDATMLAAGLCGVGLLDPCRQVLLRAEKPVVLTLDGWSWLLEEKTYRRWLIQRSHNRGQQSPSPATDGPGVTKPGLFRQGKKPFPHGRGEAPGVRNPKRQETRMAARDPQPPDPVSAQFMAREVHRVTCQGGSSSEAAYRVLERKVLQDAGALATKHAVEVQSPTVDTAVIPAGLAYRRGTE